MIQCDTFNGLSLSQNPLGLTRNRVAFSCMQGAETDGLISPTISVKYVLSGTEQYYLDGRRVSVSAGRYLVVNKARSLGFQVKSSRPVLGLCLHLRASYLYDVYCQLTKSAEWLLDHPFESTGEILFEELVSSTKENSLGALLQGLEGRLDKDAAQLHVEEESFFFQLASQLLLSHKVDRAKAARLRVQKSSTQKELLQRLATAKDLIEAEWPVTLNIATLSRACSLSPAHLFRCFKQVYGLSPHQYALHHKLQRAAQWLLSDKMTASEVAARCGFADLPSFSKAFKKTHGVSPQHFKKGCCLYPDDTAS